MRNMNYAQKHVSEAIEILNKIDVSSIEKMADLIAGIRLSEGRLFFLGVGGSAGNCSHAVNDFRKIVGIESYAPTDNVSELTARTNDEGWATVFVEWLKTSKLSDKDAVFVLSVGGGNLKENISPNLVKALQYAKSVGAKVTGIVGRDGIATSAQTVPVGMYAETGLLLVVVTAIGGPSRGPGPIRLRAVLDKDVGRALPQVATCHDARPAETLALEPAPRQDARLQVEVAADLDIGEVKLVAIGPDIPPRSGYLILSGVVNRLGGKAALRTGISDILLAMKDPDRLAENRPGLRRWRTDRGRHLPAGVGAAGRAAGIARLDPAVGIILVGVGRA